MPFLPDIPDMQGMDFAAITAWIDDRLAAIEVADFTRAVMDSFTAIELPDRYDHPLGAESSADWRRFFLAILLADWACYERVIDRADFPRLKYIMSSSQRYFRLWCCTLPDGQVTPVGYTGWYPIPKFVYDGVMANHDGVDDRGAFMPQRFVAPEDVRYGYGFNISIVRQLRNTPQSHRMIKAFQADGAAMKNVRGMAVTVDEASRRLSRIARFMYYGDITVQGEAESLFIKQVG